MTSFSPRSGALETHGTVTVLGAGRSAAPRPGVGTLRSFAIAAPLAVPAPGVETAPERRKPFRSIQTEGPRRSAASGAICGGRRVRPAWDRTVVAHRALSAIGLRWHLRPGPARRDP